MNFPFGTNGKFIILGVPILKHFRVCKRFQIFLDKLGRHFRASLRNSSWTKLFVTNQASVYKILSKFLEAEE